MLSQAEAPKRSRRWAVIVVCTCVGSLILICFKLTEPLIAELAEATQNHRLWNRLIKPDSSDPVTSYLNYWWMIGTGLFLAFLATGWTWISLHSSDTSSGGTIQTRSWLSRHRWASLVVVGLIYLLATIAGPQQDYYAFLKMWRDVVRGLNPWANNINYYGPAFNFLAIFAYIHPLLPKLVFCATWIGIGHFVTMMLPESNDRGAWGPRAWAATYFLNPYYWVEVPLCGHFDILVAACCLAAMHTRRSDKYLQCGMWLGVGFLLKFSPIIFVPYLMLDRGRIRPQVMVAFLATLAFGLTLGFLIWGHAVFAPFRMLQDRGASLMSIFRTLGPSTWWLSLPVLGATSTSLWIYCFSQRIDPIKSVIIGYLIFITFSKFGYPQYFMILFVIVSYYYAYNHQELVGSWLLVTSFFLYLGVVALYTTIFFVDFLLNYPWLGLRNNIGLVVFVLACWVLVVLLRFTDGGATVTISRDPRR